MLPQMRALNIKLFGEISDNWQSNLLGTNLFIEDPKNMLIIIVENVTMNLYYFSNF